jgi:FkbM family methyltransferase
MGRKFRLDMQTEKDYWLGTYEPELQRAISDWAKPGSVAYDLGANVGYISLMLAARVGSAGQVFAFEPLPANQDRLLANLTLNPDLPVELVCMAVAEKSEQREFHVHASDDMGKLHGSAGYENKYGGSIKVDVITVDDFVFSQQKPAPSLVKMDIEGGEVLAITGMRRVMKEVRPMMLIELHGEEAARGVWAELQNANYQLVALRTNYPQIERLEQLGRKSYVLAGPAETPTI